MPAAGSWGGARLALEETGHTSVMVTASDDLCVSVPTIKTMLAPMEVRVFVSRKDLLRVETR